MSNDQKSGKATASQDNPLILIVEDEPGQMEVLRYNLDKQGYRLLFAENGEEALLLVKEECPDLVLLDWMLPELSGIEVCRQIKASSDTRSTVVIMLTARGEETDRVRGLDTGADDFMTKPYSVAELMARIRAHLRRSNPAMAGEVLTFHDLVLDPEQHKVSRNDQPIKLGPTEYKLLCVFMEKPGRVWSREQLLDRAWGRDIYVDLRTVDVHVGRLRKALKIAGEKELIRTVRGTGYAMDITD